MARGRGGPEPGCVKHSDHGGEYASARLRDRTRGSEPRLSCGRTGSRFGNAAAESLRAPLEEEIGTRTRPDRATARAEDSTFIETFQNRRRPRRHKTSGYLTPAGAGQRHQHTLAAQPSSVQDPEENFSSSGSTVSGPGRKVPEKSHR